MAIIKAPKFKKLKLTERVKIFEFLKDVTKKDEEYVEYVPGWSDALVAKHFDCSAQSVSYVRVELVGRLRPAGRLSEKEENAMAERIASLEARISFLESELGVKK